MSKNKKSLAPTVHLKAGAINRANPDWCLHLIRNGMPCAYCGKIEYPYVRNICDCHSHGLIERHGAKYEFQVVLEYPIKTVGFVLNELGYRVRAGEVFRPGDLVEGIFEDCSVRLDKFADCDGRPILRIIIPDGQNRWPEDPACDPKYQLQRLPLVQLRNSRHLMH